MRGAHLEGLAVPFGDRIIPADAGSTSRPTWQMKNWPDHPRGCGEHRRLTVVA